MKMASDVADTIPIGQACMQAKVDQLKAEIVRQCNLPAERSNPACERYR